MVVIAGLGIVFGLLVVAQPAGVLLLVSFPLAVLNTELFARQRRRSGRAMSICQAIGWLMTFTFVFSAVIFGVLIVAVLIAIAAIGYRFT